MRKADDENLRNNHYFLKHCFVMNLTGLASYCTAVIEIGEVSDTVSEIQGYKTEWELRR